MDLTDISRTRHPRALGFTFFPQYTEFSETECTVHHRTNLNTWCQTAFVRGVFSGHHGRKLEPNNGKDFRN